MGRHRTANLLLADAMKEVERLKVKALNEQLNKHPQVVSLNTERDDLNKEVIKLRRQLGISDADKGFDSTIKRLKDQIKETVILKEVAETRLPEVENRLGEIGGELHEMKASLATDMEV